MPNKSEKKSADRECLAGGNKGRHCAKNQEASQASRKMPCGPAIAQKRPKRALSTMIMVMVMVVFVVP